MILPVWIMTLMTLYLTNATVTTSASSVETSTMQFHERATVSSETESMTILGATENVTKSYETENLTNETDNVANETENNTKSYETKNITNESAFFTFDFPHFNTLKRMWRLCQVCLLHTHR